MTIPEYEQPQVAEHDSNRRKFLINTARVGIGGFIAVTMTDLFIRSLDCEGHSVCDACLVVKKCELPLGEKFKKGEKFKEGEESKNTQVLKPIDIESLKELNHGT